MKALFFVLILAVACSGSKPKPESKVVDNFITSWESDYGPHSEKEIESFRKYLKNVEKFFVKHEIENKFPGYLTSMNNNFQLIAHMEMNLPARFKKRYGHWPVRKSANYLRYESEQTSDLRSRLNVSRREKLRQDFGMDTFMDLVKYSEKVRPQDSNFKIDL